MTIQNILFGTARPEPNPPVTHAQLTPAPDQETWATGSHPYHALKPQIPITFITSDRFGPRWSWSGRRITRLPCPWRYTSKFATPESCALLL